MKWFTAISTLACVVPVASHATTYLSVEQAKNIIFPHATLKKIDLHLSLQQQDAINKSSRLTYPLKTDQVFRTEDGGWFIVDQTLGKHEMITYAMGINANGTVKQVEVLQYNESYGDQIHQDTWLHQFVGKSVASPVILNKDIRNISGATLSSKHLTDSVRRILQFHNMVLKSLKS